MARVEAGLFMLDVDYTAATHAWIAGQKSSPYEMGLGWTVASTSRAISSAAARSNARHARARPGRWSASRSTGKDSSASTATSGLPPQIPAMAVRGSLPVLQDGQQVGYASTSTWSPVLKKYIALVHLQRPHYEPGTRVEHRDHRRAPSPAGAGARWSRCRSTTPSGSASDGRRHATTRSSSARATTA